MYILGFIILFVIIGFFIGKETEDKGAAFTLIIIITVAWAFPFGPWAIATFFELVVGYFFGARYAGLDVFEIIEDDLEEDDLEEETNLEILKWKEEQSDKNHKEYLNYLDNVTSGKVLTFNEYLEEDKKAEEKAERFVAVNFGKDKRSSRQKILDEIEEKRSERMLWWAILTPVAIIILLQVYFSYFPSD